LSAGKHGREEIIMLFLGGKTWKQKTVLETKA